MSRCKWAPFPTTASKAISLIWDLGEGVIAGDERSERRRDDPSDLDTYKQTDIELSVSHPLRRALGPTTTERLYVDEVSQDSLLLGDNCLIWCASLEPQNATERSMWQKSLEHDYDHTTFLGQPAPFARALALMASSQRNILGSYLDLQHPVTGHVEQCSNLAVFYGPVVYLDDPRDYILEPDDDLELIVRRVFTKTTEHRHQREYRFAILSRQNLNCETVHLQVPASLRQALNAGSGSRAKGLHLPEGGPALRMPSPRLLQCFDRRPTRGSTNMRARLKLSGTHDKSSTKRSVVVSKVATTDNEAIDAAIRAEPRVPDDFRIAKLIIDGGPGTIARIYCLEGILGTFELKTVSGTVPLGFSPPDTNDTILILRDLTDFDGKFQLSHSAQQLILGVVPMNPAATVEIEHPRRKPDLPQNHITLSPTEDTHVTVTATSEDGTQTSSFKIIINRALCPTNQSETA